MVQSSQHGKPQDIQRDCPKNDIDQNVADFSLRRVWVFHLDCHNIMHR